MKTGIENENGFQNETQTQFQNENEPVIWIENENELQNEIEMKNRFENENRFQNENGIENETQNELQNGFQNENENETNFQNELKALQEYNERFRRENCIELLWENFRELHKLKPIITDEGIKATIKKFSDGFKTIQEYETDYNKFRVERVWILEPTKKMIDLRIIKIEGE